MPGPGMELIGEEEKKEVLEVLEGRHLYRYGSPDEPGFKGKVIKLEEEVGKRFGVPYAVAMNSGTSALLTALWGLGIGPGDEVIVPDFTFVATASAVLYAGAMPVTVDVSPETYCIDPKLAEAAITPRTKAIIAVHMGGHPADLDALAGVAHKKGIALVEDSSHAHASEWKGRRIGAIGTAGTFSFQASKLMTAGEGGMIISNDDQFERQARSVHDCGRMPGEWFYSHYINGSNYRLSEWQGAVLSVQLTRLDAQTKRRHQNARLLDRLLSDIPGITPQKLDPRCTRNGQYAYIFHVDSKRFAGASTEILIQAMNAEGIPNQASYPPVHALDVFQNGEYRNRLCGSQATEAHAFLQAQYPITHRAAWETIWIPQPALLGDEADMHEIAAAWTKIHEHAKELV